MLKEYRYIFFGFALYFGLFLVPKIDPSFGASQFAYLLAVSAVIVLPILVLLGLWGTVALVFAKLQKKPIGPRSKTASAVAFAGLSIFVTFLILSNVLPSPLPSGSYSKEFDRAIWLDPASTEYREGDITPRQKMLADVISRFPGKSRVEIERMLGPSLDTQYFKSTGRDLIYVSGPERDSFFSIDSEWLLIWIDEKGIYKRHAIVTD